MKTKNKNKKRKKINKPKKRAAANFPTRANNYNHIKPWKSMKLSGEW